ncbi:unnamed protein product [Vicia faba]|uniref:Uncharacterized protein n=1 Tax=Vicia faba TaxID=3906 RepID=A0AAV0YQ93_VICFA|nr:unnamed protein product [Vicia faba]
MCFENAHNKFHEKLSGIMEPLLEMFKPEFLPAPEVDLALVVSKQEVWTEQETQLKFTHPFEQQIISQSEKPHEFELGTTSGSVKPYEFDFMHLVVMKTLEEIKQENAVVKTRLNKQGEMFKEKDHTNTKIEGLLQVILSRLLPLPEILFKMFLSFF